MLRHVLAPYAKASRSLAIAAVLATPACAGAVTGPVPVSHAQALPATPAFDARLTHAAIGFSVDTPARVETAARQGITATILYSGSPGPKSALARALVAHRMSVIDGSIASELYYWECHRTHTVAKPPKGYSNYYCSTDGEPGVDSQAVVLAYVSRLLSQDAKRPYVAGYWVLDDWPGWDGGSALSLLQKIHAKIAAATPGRPAICGFGATILRGTHYGWDPSTGDNYSNAGCDAVGWYNYSAFGLTKPQSGLGWNWSMRGLLKTMARTLEYFGWQESKEPLIGIGQAWGGAYGSHFYQPGLTAAQMKTQADAFCAFGAQSIAWYAWDDSGFKAATQTPDNSPAIANGISAGIADCRAGW